MQSNHERSERLRRFLEVDPANAALRVDHFEALLAEGRLPEAIAAAQDAMARWPDPLAWQYRLGVAQARSGAWAEAEQTLSALFSDGPPPPALAHEMAQVKLRLGKDEDAIALLRVTTQADDHHRHWPMAELTLLRTLHRTGDLEGALDAGQRAVARRPEDLGLRAALATICLDAERLDLLPDLLAPTAVTDQPHASATAARVHAELDCARAFLALREEDTAGATAAFRRSLLATPDFARSRLGLGMTLAMAGDTGNAEAELQQATRLMPGYLGGWHALAWLQLTRGDLDAAHATFCHVLDLDDTFAESHGGLALVAALRGDAVAARTHLRTALRLDRHSANALATQLVLRHGGLHSPELLRDGLATLARNPAVRLPSSLRREQAP